MTGNIRIKYAGEAEHQSIGVDLKKRYNMGLV